MVGCAEFAKKLSGNKTKKEKQSKVEKALENNKNACQQSFYDDPWQSEAPLDKVNLPDDEQPKS